MKKTKEEAERTRERIFRAGLKVFSRKGYAAATLSDVAREAGISRGAIYWHYKNKESFFHEVEERLETYYDDMVESITQSTKPFLERIREAVVGLLTRFNEDEEFRLMEEFFLRSLLNHGGPDTTAIRREWEQRPLKLIRQAIDSGEIFGDWNADSALLAIDSGVTGLFFQLIQHEITLSNRQIGEFADFVVRGFTSKCATGGGSLSGYSGDAGYRSSKGVQNE
jgi:TetR/AcrR family acrAB operon transcriptional repressor